MNEKVVKSEIEDVEVVDLGDATVETRQWHPVQIIQDSSTQWGRPAFY
ncbi:MAG: hypothetical protein SXG53_04190 [Pseudomonadota bacterium]|nr:hypothetical protein [Pseudomonadota bacterium]